MASSGGNRRSIMKIFEGRKIVNKYRENHKNGDHSINLKEELGKLYFLSIQDFFDKNESFIKEELEKMYIRKGNCNQCGKCCITGKGCQYYDNGCTRYEQRNEICKNYPNPKDFLLGLPKECSYVFEKTDYKSIKDLIWQ